jgi:hypothetical protein
LLSAMLWLWSVWLTCDIFHHIHGNSCLYYLRLLLLNVNLLCGEFTGNSPQFILGNSIWPFGLKLLYIFPKYLKTEEVIMLINLITSKS